MVFESVVVDVLNRFLGDYVVNLDSSQLKLGIWGGDAVLRNLDIKENALSQLDIPFKVRSGHIEKLELKIPWKNLYSQSVEATLAGVYLLIVPTASIKYDAEKEEKQLQEARQSKLQRIEETKLKAEEREKPKEKQDTFVEKLVTQVIKNLQVKISNIHIRYEDDITNPKSPLSFGVSLQNLSLQLVQLDNLFAYWNVNSKLYSNDSSKEALYLSILELLGSVDMMSRNLPYRKFRPEVPVHSNAKLWWKYVTTCIFDVNVKPRLEMWSWKHIRRHRQKVRTYKELYKMRITTKKPSEELLKLLQEPEKTLDIFNITLARQQAEMEASKAGLKIYRPGVKVEEEESGGWLGWMWSWSGEKQEDKETKSGGFDELMTPAEKAKLCKAIGYSETAVDPTLPKDFEAMKLSFQLLSMSFSIKEDYGKPEIIKVSIIDLSTMLTQRPGAQAIKLSAKISTFEVTGLLQNLSTPILLTSRSAEVENKNPLLSLLFETNPLDGSADQRLRVEAQPLEIVYDAVTVNSLSEFFMPPQDMQLEELTSATLMKLEEFRDRTSTGLMYVIETQKILDLKINLMASYIIVPQTGFYTSSENLLVLDLGHLKVTSKSRKGLPQLTVGQSCIEDIMSRAYESFDVELSSLQLLYSKPEQDWKNARKSKQSSLHILEPVDLRVDFSRSMVVSDPRMPKFKIFGELPLLSVRISDEKVKDILALIDSIPLPKGPPAPSASNAQSTPQAPKYPLTMTPQLTPRNQPLPNLRSSVMFESESEEEFYDAPSSPVDDLPFFEAQSNSLKRKRNPLKKQESVKNMTNFQLRFEINEVSIQLCRLSENVELTVLHLYIEGLGTELNLRSFDMSSSTFLKEICLKCPEYMDSKDKPVYIITTQDNSETDLLTLDYIKAEKNGPEFKMLYNNTEQLIKVNFSSLDVHLHIEALLNAMNFLNNLIPPSEKDTSEESAPTVGEEKKEGTTVAKKSTPKKSKFEDVISLHVLADLSCLKIYLRGQKGHISEISIEGLVSQVIMRKRATEILAKLKNIVILDCDDEALYKKAVSIAGKEVFSFKMISHVDATEGNAYTDMNIVDSCVTLTVGCIQVIFVNKFVSSILDFINHFQTAKDALTQATVQAAGMAATGVMELAERSTRMALDIDVKAPVVVVPQSAVSKTVIVADFGLITVKNHFSVVQSKTHINIPPVIDAMKVELSDLKLYRTTFQNNKFQSEIQLLQPVNLDLVIERNLSAAWFNEIPDIKITGHLKPMNVQELESRDERLKLAEFKLGLISTAVTMLSDSSMKASVKLANCLLDDKRQIVQKATPRMVEMKPGFEKNEMVDISYRQGRDGTVIDTIVRDIHLCASMEFLLTVADIFVKASQLSSVAAQKKKPVTTATKVLQPCDVFFQSSQTSSAPQKIELGIKCLTLKVSPVIINTVITITSALSPAAETPQELESPVPLNLWDIKQVKDLKLWFLEEDHENKNSTVAPLVPQGESLKMTIESIFLTLEAGVGHRTVPMLLAKSAFSCNVTNWSTLINLQSLLNLEVHYYNEVMGVWEPLLEPLDEETSDNFRPWTLGIKMKKKPVGYTAESNEVDCNVPDYKTVINISSKDQLNITLSKCALVMLGNLGTAFAEAASQTSECFQKDQAPFVIKNCLGIPVMVSHSDTFSVIGLDLGKKDYELQDGESLNMDYLRTMSEKDQFVAMTSMSGKRYYIQPTPLDHTSANRIPLTKVGRGLYSVVHKDSGVTRFIVCQIYTVEGSKVIIIRSPFQPVTEDNKVYEKSEGFTYELIADQSGECLQRKCHRSSDQSLIINVVPVKDDLTCNRTEGKKDHPYIAHLWPTVLLRNLLPYPISYSLEENTNPTAILTEGHSAQIHTAVLDQSKLELCVLDYLNQKWKGQYHIKSDQLEIDFIQFTSLSEDDRTELDIAIHVTYNIGQTVVAVHSPYWMVNKTGRLLQYKADDVHRKHPQDYEMPLLFSFKPNKFFQKNKVQLMVSDSELSDKFSLDTVGSYGDVKCKARNKDYLVGVKIDASSFSLTRIVTFIPFYMLVNRTNHQIEVSEEGKDKWTVTDSNQSVPFWPEKDSAKLLIKVQGCQTPPQAINFNRQENCNLLHLDYKDKFLEINSDDPKLYLASFYEGLQRVALFTEDESVYKLLRDSEKAELAEQEITLSLQNMGISLVNNCSNQEVSFIGITSSDIIWEAKPKRKSRWKPMHVNQTDLLESAFQEYIDSGPVDNLIVNLDSNFQVCLTPTGTYMKMLLPHETAIRRNFLPAVKVEYSISARQKSYRVQIYRIQIQNQLPGAIFPFVFYPIKPPKSVTMDSEPKPLADVSIVTRSAGHSDISRIKYFMVLIQEMGLKLDLGFLYALSELFTQDNADEASTEQMIELFKKDIECLKMELNTVSATDTSAISLYEYFHISPIKLHLSLSLSTGGEDGNKEKRQTEVIPVQSLNLLLMSIGATLTDAQDVVFKLAFFELTYQFCTTQQLQWEVIRHYSKQAIKQMYVLVLGLDVLGNPFGLIRGLSEGFEAFFYEPYKGAIQGPEEFAEGMALGVKALVGGAVGGLAGAASRITGAMAKGVAAMTLDEEYQQKRREEMNTQPSGLREGLTRGGKGLVSGFVSGITGIVTKPIKGAQKEGAAGFFKGVGKGLVGAVTRPTGGIIDMASSTFQGIKRATESSEGVESLRPPRFIHEDGVIRPYREREGVGSQILQKIENGRFAKYRYFAHANVNETDFFMITKSGIFFVTKGTFGQLTCEWQYCYDEFTKEPLVVDGRRLRIEAKWVLAKLEDARDSLPKY
ncbi:Vacuolar protein sorting-associated protein 13A [Acipenser ruthenus]|uniref:Vacuolar protein sorting-associated protein 13A n=1 Tax=Acipenser ruthenus TaxID=7906 RepID=A0A444UCT0_ACIRT|nr:Vacuolar protein sorting-associated protein 13A [Acipenser ruthenus]